MQSSSYSNSLSDQTFAALSLTDNELLHEEISDMEKVTADKNAIILRAAGKLKESGKYDKDPTAICSRLVKIWGKVISASHIRETLPEDFKRPYTKPEDESVPETTVQEIFALMSECHSDLGKVASDILAKIKDNPDIEEQITESLTKINITELHNLVSKLSQINTTGDLKKYIKLLKKFSIDIGLIKEYTDFREKLDAFLKIQLKLMFMTDSLSNVGKKIHYSSKWMSATEKSTELDLLIAKLQRCPHCGHNLADWFNKARIAAQRGDEIPSPETVEFMHICGNPFPSEDQHL